MEEEGASKGTQTNDSCAETGGGIDCGCGGDRVGESNDEKVRTTVTEQQ